MILLTAVFAIFQAAYAYETTSLSVKKAVIYNNGANLTIQATVSVSNGSGELVFYPIPAELDPNSLTASIDKNVQVMGVGIRNWNPQNEAKIDRLSFQIDSIQELLERLIYKRDVFVSGVLLLNNNRIISREYDGVKTEFLKKTMEVYHAGKMEVYAKVNKLDFEIVRLFQVQKQLKETLAKENQLLSSGQKEMVISYATTERKQAVNVKVVGFSTAISWLPRYDVEVQNSALNFTLKAEIFQRTGVDFTQTSLVLSNGQPKTNQDLPTLKTVYFMNALNVATASQNQVAVPPIPESPIAVVNNKQMLDRFNPISIVFPEIIFSNGDALEEVNLKGISYQKYEESKKMVIASQEGLSLNKSSSIREISSLAATTSGVTASDAGSGLSLRGGREETTAYFVDGIRMRGSAKIPDNYERDFKEQPAILYQPVQDQLKSQILEFEVPGLVDVPSTYQGFMVKVNETKVAASFQFAAYPTASNQAWCIAEVPNREKYNLLHANATFFANGACLGKADFNPDVVEDTLTFSIGKIQDMTIQKKQKTVEVNRKLIEGKCVYTITYELKVQNLASESRIVQITDLIPSLNGATSTNKVVVKADAKVSEQESTIDWELQVEGSKTKVISYTVEITI